MTVVFETFSGNYQDYNEKPFKELKGKVPWIQGPSATFNQPSFLLEGTVGIAGLLLFPNPTVAPYQTEAGVNGVLTNLTFTPSPKGSIQGSAVSVEERVGSFAYYTQAAAIGKKISSDFKSAIKKDAALSSDLNFVAAQSAQLLQPTTETNLTVAANLTQEAQGLGDLGLTKLANDVSALGIIAAEWETPEFFLGKGKSLQQVDAAALADGVDLTTAGGTPATWTVSNKKVVSGVVELSGYTAVGVWNGDPNKAASNGVFDIEDAVGDPVIDVSAVTVAAVPPAGAPGNGAQLLAQSMASFGAGRGVAVSGGNVADHHHRSSDFLAPPHHG